MADGTAKSLGEKLVDALDAAADNPPVTWPMMTPLAQAHHEKVALAFVARLSHDTVTQAVIDCLSARIAEERFQAAAHPLGDARSSRHGGVRDGLKEALEIILIALHGSAAHG